MLDPDLTRLHRVQFISYSKKNDYVYCFACNRALFCNPIKMHNNEVEKQSKISFKPVIIFENE